MNAEAFRAAERRTALTDEQYEQLLKKHGWHPDNARKVKLREFADAAILLGGGMPQTETKGEPVPFARLTVATNSTGMTSHRVEALAPHEGTGDGVYMLYPRALGAAPAEPRSQEGLERLGFSKDEIIAMILGLNRHHMLRAGIQSE